MARKSTALSLKARTPPATKPLTMATSRATATPQRSDALPASNEMAREATRLGFLIHDVSRLRRAAYDQMMRPLNITRARWWVLAHLARNDGLMQSELAAVLDVGKASLGSVIDQLEADGWLQRQNDPSDRRAKRIYLSPATQPLIRQMTASEEAFNRRVLADLDPDERATLLRLLGKIKTALVDVPAG